jgi:pSer/pThr/pTyr-binding forkhead associated (FHA) protein
MKPDGREERQGIAGTRFQLGREPDSDWVFQFADSPTVSGKHAAIVRQGPDYYVEDLNSSNGTFLNDAPLRTRHKVQHGDVIALGRTGPRLRFELRE